MPVAGSHSRAHVEDVLQHIVEADGVKALVRVESIRKVATPDVDPIRIGTLGHVDIWVDASRVESTIKSGQHEPTVCGPNVE